MFSLRKLFTGPNEPESGHGLSNEQDTGVPNIFLAARSGHLGMLEEALKHWDVNAVDDNKMTALHHAASQLQFEAVDRLLQEIPNGLDAGIEDEFGRDAAWLAIDVYGHESEPAKQMYDKLCPYVYPDSAEDKELSADTQERPSEP